VVVVGVLEKRLEALEDADEGLATEHPDRVLAPRLVACT